MRYVPLEDEAARMKPELTSWAVADRTISREFHLPSFAAISDFVRDVIATAERLDHHPDLDIRYPDLVLVRSSTHAIGGLSDADVTLAVEIDSIARRHRAID